MGVTTHAPMRPALSARRGLLVAHRWAGLALLLPLLSQGVTGVILAVTPIWPTFDAAPALSDGPAHPASAIVAAAAMPGLVAARYHPATAHSPALVDLALPGERAPRLEVMVDPASLAVLGSHTPSAAYRWVHSLHENLLMPERGGRSVTGWFGVGLLLLGLCGVVLWWPPPGRWGSAIRVDRRAVGARLQRELHGAAGFWFSAMLVLMSASGITLAFPQTIRAVFAIPGGPPAQTGDRVPLDLDAVLARAEQVVPGAVVRDVRLPERPGRPVVLRLERIGALQGAPPVVATIDAGGSRVLALQDPRTMGVAALTLGWLRALHFGDAFGLPWRLLVALTGMALPLMAVTGGALWWLKRRNRLRLAARRRVVLQP